ncbi:MAG: hypothetical protein ABSE73_05615, partial [Planctomycetota bacterium]
SRAANASPPNEALVLPLLEALSALGHRGVIDTAVLLLRHHGAPLSKNVLMAAVKALAPFYRDPVVAEELERMRKDKDPDIARLALVCLRGIVAAQQQPVPLPPFPQAPEAAGKAPEPVPPRKASRGFEFLEASEQVAEHFKPGANIGGLARGEAPLGVSASAQNPFAGTLAAGASPPAGEPALEGLSPSVEGLLENFGLVATVRMVGARDGVLRINSAAGEGRVYIQERKIIDAVFAAERGLAALAAMQVLQQAHFAYFPMELSLPPILDLGISGLQEVLKQQQN